MASWGVAPGGYGHAPLALPSTLRVQSHADLGHHSSVKMRLSGGGEGTVICTAGRKMLCRGIPIGSCACRSQQPGLIRRISRWCSVRAAVCPEAVTASSQTLSYAASHDPVVHP